MNENAVVDDQQLLFKWILNQKQKSNNKINKNVIFYDSETTMLL